MGRRQMAARALGRCGLFRTASVRPAGDRLLVFNYHRLRADEDLTVPTFDDGVFHTTASGFARQMVWLAQHTRVLAQDELIRHIVHGEPYTDPRPACAVTFDDGYIDTYTLAFPILRSLGLPAILFLPTDPIDQRQLGWWDHIAYLIRQSPRPVLHLDGLAFCLPDEAQDAMAAFQERMKRWPASRTRDLVPRLAEACGVRLPSTDVQGKELITWDQALELDRGGVAIGSHTASHRVLATLDDEEQALELSRSRERLEQVLGREVTAIGYPVGGAAHLSDRTLALARAAGYEIGFTYLSGFNRFGRIDPLAVRRLAGPEHEDLLEAQVRLPELFTLALGARG